MAIERFTGDYRFLSNFWPCEVELDGITYSSSEHAYQAAKTMDLSERRKVRDLTAGEAKRFGRHVKLRPDWEVVKLGIMEDLLKQKFKRGTELAEKLKATGSETLVEGNTWDDTFWGVCKGRGHNHLGKILMRIRNEL